MLTLWGGISSPERATAGSVPPVPGEGAQHHRARASRSGHDLPSDPSEEFDLTSGPRVEMKSGTDGPFPSHSHRAGSLPGPCGWSREERAGAEAAGRHTLQRAANESSYCLSLGVHLGFATWAPRETTEPEPPHQAGQHPICGIKGLSKAASVTGRPPPAAGTEDAQ